MTGLKARVFKPSAAAHAFYRELYALYKSSTMRSDEGLSGNLHGVMKELIAIRSRVRK